MATRGFFIRRRISNVSRFSKNERPLSNLLIEAAISGPIAIIKSLLGSYQELFFYPSGSKKFVGQTKDGRYHGQGVFYNKEGKVIYAGEFLNGKHGGIVASAGKEKLSDKQLFSGAEFQIITGALQYCPKQVPDDVKAKVEEAIKKQKGDGKS